MSTSEKPSHWWAPTGTRARLTSAGAVILIGGLVTTSVVVWNSPSNSVAETFEASITGVSEDDRAAADRAELVAEIADLEAQLARREQGLDAATDESAEIQQKLWSAEGLIEAMERYKGTGKTVAAPRVAPRPSVFPSPKTAPAPASTPAPSTRPANTGTPAAPVASPSPAPAPAAPAPAAPLTTLTKAQVVNPDSPYLGIYTEQAPFNWATYDMISTDIGVTPNVVGYFGGWDEPFRANAVTRAWEQGTLPVLTWESRPISSPNSVTVEPEYSLPRIIGDPAAGVPGEFDDYLRQYARDIVATGLPMGIRLNHEMNGTWYPWAETTGRGEPINGNRSGDYVKTWQHVHDIFEAEGANDLVFWIWSPNRVDRLPASHRTSEYLDGLYPGNEYVDWVGMSGYLRPPYDEDAYDFDSTFGATIAELRRVSDKPIFLAEIGASETGGYKPAWVESLFENLAAPQNADIIGLSWFNLAVSTYVGGELGTNDWRIDSRADSLAAFRDGLAVEGSRFDLEPIE
ncbi:glycosyl hydrolase [Marisediminicola senii]|uniref:glycosyl hydrolase n=1 Tax=Marisediminicola senii TaxID=2711233 RepID=UPI0013EE2AFB|nr:glycosyl hydrolase [Marisediminicola senii]